MSAKRKPKYEEYAMKRKGPDFGKAVKKLGDFLEIAEGLKIDYGGKNKIDNEKLRMIKKGLLGVYSDLKNFRKEPRVGMIIRTITEAQASITQIKMGGSKERNLGLLVEHIRKAIAMIGAQRKAA